MSAARESIGPASAGLLDSIRAASERSGEIDVLPLAAEVRLSRDLDLSRREVEVVALQARVLPWRYQRSLGTVGWEGQDKLLRSRALVVGAGGLGGYIAEGLARMGVGRIDVVDGDIFQEHNLNRQLLCTEDDLGRPKAEAACERIRRVNGAVEVAPHVCFLDESNADSLVSGVDVAVDGLDSIPTRLILQEAAQRRGIPLVHGAIAGFYAQVMTIYPEDRGLFRFYRKDRAPVRGVEVQLGNPAATPMLCAALQVHEAVKVLLGIGTPLRNRMVTIDARDGYVDVQELG